MSKLNYRARQRSQAWLNTWIYISGVALNCLALASLVNLFFTKPSEPPRGGRLRIELEDAKSCTKHLAGRRYIKGSHQTLALKLSNGKERDFIYISQSTYGFMKNGNSIEMAAARYDANPDSTGLLFFEVNANGDIQSCIAAQGYPFKRFERLDCLAAAGEALPSGECKLEVAMPSDCKLMNGKLEGKICTVTAGNTILKAKR